MKKEELEKKILEVQDVLDSLKKDVQALANVPAAFEKGKWYKSSTDQSKCLLIFDKVNIKNAEHCDALAWIYLSSVSDNTEWHGADDNVARLKDLVPASPEEIKSALIKEAERRGFKEGVKFNCLHKISNASVTILWYYYSEDDVLSGGNGIVYEKGKWAEIVSEPEIKIGGYAVKFHEVGKPSFNGSNTLTEHTSIDGHQFTKEFWEAAKVIAEHDKAKVKIGCSHQFDVSLDQINQILKGFKN